MISKNWVGIVVSSISYETHDCSNYLGEITWDLELD